MILGDVNFAFRKAMENFDTWNDITGAIDKYSSLYIEIEDVIKDAVRIGIMATLGAKEFFDNDGNVKTDYLYSKK